jgi:hypothetical protein
MYFKVPFEVYSIIETNQDEKVFAVDAVLLTDCT